MTEPESLLTGTHAFISLGRNIVPSPAALFDMTGKVALVTGGSRGIGRAIVNAFAAAGADVIIASRKLDVCEEAAEAVRAAGRRALAVSCHVGKWDEIDRLLKTACSAFGGVDVVVNNAGMSPPAPSSDQYGEELFDKIQNVNFKGPFRLMALAARHMAERGGGSIINISSTAAVRPNPSTAPYAAAKAALNAASVSVALEYAARGVRVNIVSPGSVATDVSAFWTDPEQIRMRAAAQRVADPREIVTAALYFASTFSSFTTGANLRVDGGRS